MPARRLWRTHLRNCDLTVTSSLRPPRSAEVFGRCCRSPLRRSGLRSSQEALPRRPRPRRRALPRLRRPQRCRSLRRGLRRLPRLLESLGSLRRVGSHGSGSSSSSLMSASSSRARAVFLRLRWLHPLLLPQPQLLAALVLRLWGSMELHRPPPSRHRRRRLQRPSCHLVRCRHWHRWALLPCPPPAWCRPVPCPCSPARRLRCRSCRSSSCSCRRRSSSSWCRRSSWRLRRRSRA
mmetsp:Transcript_38592/g.96947  ORF Transcript_38592/g.96947 Transcript_38592/m.96947 type:complete len:236 (-) Transcript_38592:1185-1892(-)